MCDVAFTLVASVFGCIWSATLIAILIELDKMNRFLKYSIWMGLEQVEHESVDENESETEPEPENDLKKDD